MMHSAEIGGLSNHLQTWIFLAWTILNLGIAITSLQLLICPTCLLVTQFIRSFKHYAKKQKQNCFLEEKTKQKKGRRLSEFPPRPDIRYSVNQLHESEEGEGKNNQ
ncbi:hypothetical protein AMECASPLE_033333 [Ameca splendens]|uniref:Transmembrane protein n=1 Tax=Ameca splendens TaxID=208324 RepID=A0ABV1A5A9_9TELE